MSTKPIIKFEDWQKLDIRIGRIESAEAVPESKKLVKMHVDFGDFKRQICAGIIKSYSPEQLTGRQSLFLVNMETKAIAGLESQGMLLATHMDDNTPVVLMAEKEVKNGADIG